MNEYDLIIVGGGPAGLTAGLYTTRLGLSSLIIEKQLEGGKVLEAYNIENYPGVSEKINGHVLIEHFKKQLSDHNVLIHALESVISVEKKDVFHVRTDKNEYTSKALIIATGTHLKRLNVPGEKEYRGRGLSYCATCDGPLFRNKRVAIVGGGNTAVSSALYLSELCKTTYLIHRRDSLRAENALADNLKKADVTVLWDSIVQKIEGDKFVRNVVIENVKTHEVRSMFIDGVFILVGYEPNNELAKNMGLTLTKFGFIEIDKKCRTNIDGIFAAGDITGVALQIAAAVGQGCTASLEAYEYVKRN